MNQSAAIHHHLLIATSHPHTRSREPSERRSTTMTPNLHLRHSQSLSANGPLSRRRLSSRKPPHHRRSSSLHSLAKNKALRSSDAQKFNKKLLLETNGEMRRMHSTIAGMFGRLRQREVEKRIWRWRGMTAEMTADADHPVLDTAVMKMLSSRRRSYEEIAAMNVAHITSVILLKVPWPELVLLHSSQTTKESKEGRHIAVDQS